MENKAHPNQKLSQAIGAMALEMGVDDKDLLATLCATTEWCAAFQKVKCEIFINGKRIDWQKTIVEQN